LAQYSVTRTKNFSTRAKYDPLPPSSKFNPHPSRTQSSADSNAHQCCHSNDLLLNPEQGSQTQIAAPEGRNMKLTQHSWTFL